MKKNDLTIEEWFGLVNDFSLRDILFKNHKNYLKLISSGVDNRRFSSFSDALEASFSWYDALYSPKGVKKTKATNFYSEWSEFYIQSESKKFNLINYHPFISVWI